MPTLAERKSVVEAKLKLAQEQAAFWSQELAARQGQLALLGEMERDTVTPAPTADTNGATPPSAP